MAAREWLIPLIIGGLVAGGMYVFQDSLPSRTTPGEDGQDPPPGGAEGPVLVLVPGSGAAPGSYDLLVVTPGNLEPPMDPPAFAGLVMTNLTPHVATAGTTLAHPDPDCRNLTAEAQGNTSHPCFDNRLRFGQDGILTARLTFYAFTDDGRLFASNAPQNDTRRFPLHDEYVRFPASTFWYFGTGTVPEGAEALPILKREARTALNGLPVGAVATASTSEFAWYLDSDLHLTTRIEQLVP